jgi:hypothetical protein
VNEFGVQRYDGAQKQRQLELQVLNEEIVE